MAELPLLSLLVWLPVLGGVGVLAMHGFGPVPIRWFALLVTLLVFLLSVQCLMLFDSSTPVMQFSEQRSWIPSLGISYQLGVDGVALALVLLSSFMGVLVVIGSWDSIHSRLAEYLAAFLILEGLMHGVFVAMDAILFYLFWEAMLIPMFLIIGMWGGPRRVYAAFKLFLFTFVGSVCMLVALLYLYVHAGSFAILVLHELPLSMEVQQWLFIAFLLAFAVKIPMWPVHTWLPDAHVEAPTGGSVILAAIMLKMGGYGFYRFCLPVTPDASLYFSPLLIILSLIAIVYIGLVALVQTDMKKLIAYSSISHMGFATLGLFVVFDCFASTGATLGGSLALQGAMMQMISHGFISAALFFCVGVLYERMHSRDIGSYGGVANTMPRFAAFMMLFAMANAGLPGTSGFVGEFLVILGSFQANVWIAFFAGLTLVLGAAYTLWMYKRVMFGEVGNSKVEALTDINARETLIFSLLAGMVLLLGVWPAPVFELMQASIEHLQQQMLAGKF